MFDDIMASLIDHSRFAAELIDNARRWILFKPHHNEIQHNGEIAITGFLDKMDLIALTNMKISQGYSYMTGQQK